MPAASRAPAPAPTVEAPYLYGGDYLIDAEVCVIGSGAGGAVAAAELARAGLQVVVLEQGGNHPRQSYTARPLEMMKRMYADIGMTAALGKPGVALPFGRCLGGTTVINSGTCFRTPPDVVQSWHDQLGLSLSHHELVPCFETLEKELHIRPGAADLLGGAAAKVALGAKQLGLRVKALSRNARGCNGCGVCCFGCPTGAKQAMHETYLPRAAADGARLLTGCVVERILTRSAPGGRASGRVAGVDGTLVDPETRERRGRLRVRAPLVLLSGGTLFSPLVMLRSGLDDSRTVGRGLQLHPASKVSALFDDDIGWEGIPQSAYIDDLHDQGLMFEGVSMPPDLGSLALPFYGRPHLEVMEHYRQLASFGAMVKDTGRGRVRRGLFGSPLITYDFHRDDAARLQKALAMVAEMFLLAGAREAFVPVHGFHHVRTRDQLEAFKRASVPPSDFDLIGFHPLGTCRMGSDPEKSVVDSMGQSHQVAGLFIADGSVVPTSLGVNPQVTIMALAMRTARYMAAERAALLR
jgi:choline dehydrogenase-like flavoprotein